MLRIISIFLLFTLIGCNKESATTTTTTLSSQCTNSGNDIVFGQISRPSGLPQTGYTSDGPGPRRILLASSTDGVTFTRLSKLVSDQANTPNMIVRSNGKILIYYTAYDIDASASSSDGHNQDAIAVAVSDDQGTSWTHYCVGMAGFGSHAPIGDPDIIRLSDGTYRMYVTNGGSNNTINIYSATSTDGMNFTKEGTALNTSSSNYKDSLTAYVGGQYVMYVLRSDNGYMKQATSSNGTSFTSTGDNNYTITVGSVAEQFVLSNWFESSSGNFRVFGFSGATKDIRSFTTTSGTSLTPVSTVSLGLPLDSTYEKSWVKDAAVQRLNDGTYLMAYVSEIP